jgi:hypothetical protein
MPSLTDSGVGPTGVYRRLPTVPVRYVHDCHISKMPRPTTSCTVIVMKMMFAGHISGLMGNSCFCMGVGRRGGVRWASMVFAGRAVQAPLCPLVSFPSPFQLRL